MENFLKNRKINKEKLLKFGFKEENKLYVYNCPVFDNQFELSIQIDITGKINTKLIESATEELYTLHLVEDACGDFVGRVRKEYNDIIEKVSSECFEPDVFKNSQTNELISYIREKYNDELEFLWEKFPDNAIVRRKDNSKWYGAFLTVQKQKLGFKGNNSTVEVLDIRAEDVDKIVDNKRIFPGYHMNKKHWITIILDGSVSLDVIKEKIDESYVLAKKKK